MKKSLLLVLVLFVFGIGQAAIFYVSPTGNDATGNGSIGNPWKTVKKATTTVTTPGDIIHVTAGTYLETSTLFLAVGVSLEGEGAANTILSQHLLPIGHRYLN